MNAKTLAVMCLALIAGAIATTESIAERKQPPPTPPALVPLHYVDAVGTVVGRHAVATLDFSLLQFQSSPSPSSSVAIAEIDATLVAIPVAAMPTTMGEESVWFAPFPAYLYFTSTDCTGTALIARREPFYQPTIAGVRNGRVFSINGHKLLYIPAAGPSTEIYAYSRMSVDGSCAQTPLLTNGSAVEKVIDLATLYTEPLSLQ